MMNARTRLLIVDDDADDRALFIEAVKEIDDAIECITANDGLQALELLRSLKELPTIIILDLRMPRFNGKKCLIEIKADERLKHIPVMVYTTSNDVEESKELQQIGAFHFATKPSNPGDIYFLVSLMLEEQGKISPDA